MTQTTNNSAGSLVAFLLTTIATLVATASISQAERPEGTVYIFDGGAPPEDSSSWFNPLNWEGHVAPPPGSAVQIGVEPSRGVDGEQYDTILPASFDVSSLTLAFGSTIEFGPGATLTIGDLFVPSNGLVTGDGTIVLNGMGDVGGLGLSPGESFNLVINGQCDVDGQIFSNVGAEGGMIDVFGLVRCVPSVNPSTTLGEVLVHVGGEIQALAGLTELDRVTNHGTIRAAAGAQTITLSNFDPTPGSSVLVESGEARIITQVDPVLEGTFDVADGAELSCEAVATITAPTIVSGDGTLEVASVVSFTDYAPSIQRVSVSGLLNIFGQCAVNDLFFAGTTQYIGGGDASDILDINGELTVGSSQFSQIGDITVNVLGGATIEGVGVVDGAQLHLQSDTTITEAISTAGTTGGRTFVAPGVTVTLEGAGSFVGNSSNPTDYTVNQGLIVKTSPASASVNFIVNEGIIDIQAGTVNLQSDALHTGDLIIAEDALVVLSGGTFMPEGSITGAGGIQIPGGVTDTFLGLVDIGLIDIDAGGGNFNTDALCGTLDLAQSVNGDGSITVRELFNFGNGIVGLPVNVDGACAITGGTIASVGQGQTLTLNGPTEWQSGGVKLESGAIFNVGPQGVMTVSNGINLGSSTTGTLDNQGTIIIDQPGIFQVVTNNANPVNNGIIELRNGTLEYTFFDVHQQSSGVHRLLGGSLSTPGMGTWAVGGGLVEGTGTLTEPELDIANAALAPGAGIGTLEVTGDVQMNANSYLLIELNGSTPGVDHDQLIVGGALNLAGALVIDYADGYLPNEGDSFTIATAGSVTGTFDTIEGAGDYTATYHPNAVEVTIAIPDETCESDFGNDDETDIPDLLQILSAWGPCPPPCPEDLDADGMVDITDLLALFTLWGPCPGELVYDITFEAPTHTVGELPATGAGLAPRNVVTGFYLSAFMEESTEFEIVSGYPGFTSQALRFATAGLDFAEVRCLLLGLPASPRYRMEYDVVLSSVSSGPVAHYTVVNHQGQNNASLTSLQIGGNGDVAFPFQADATLPQDAVVKIAMEFDYEAGTVTYFFDQDQIWSGMLQSGAIAPRALYVGMPSAYLEQIDFAIDNIRVIAID